MEKKIQAYEAAHQDEIEEGMDEAMAAMGAGFSIEDMINKAEDFAEGAMGGDDGGGGDDDDDGGGDDAAGGDEENGGGEAEGDGGVMQAFH